VTPDLGPFAEPLSGPARSRPEYRSQLFVAGTPLPASAPRCRLTFLWCRRGPSPTGSRGPDRQYAPPRSLAQNAQGHVGRSERSERSRQHFVIRSDAAPSRVLSPHLIFSAMQGVPLDSLHLQFVPGQDQQIVVPHLQ